jgi:predicted amidohydrolase
MPEPFTIAAAQPPCSPHDVAANALIHADAIRSAAARVVVFPELSITGYELDAEAIDADDPRLTAVVAACAETASLALLGAPAAGSGGRSHIAMLAADGSGVSVAYRKIWLGGAEPEHFEAGEAPAVLEVDGWRLGLAICKDTGVPEHAAATAALGMDAYVAGMLESAEDAHVLDERARRVAGEHGVPIVIASFAGSTGGGFDSAAGRSGIWGPDGLEIARAGPEPDDLARATLSGG